MQILKLKGIQDLPPKHERSVTHLRPKIPICLIDDKPQKALIATLRSHNYNVTKFDDIKRISDVAEFPIVVTDIMGIGKCLGSDEEGWHVVRELRSQWPLKHIIAYSAGAWNVTYSKYFEDLDGYLQKDARIEEWITRLDGGVAATGDPGAYWNRLRDILLKQGVSTYDVAQLEDAFVRDIKSGDRKRMNRLWIKLEKEPYYAKVIPILKPAISMAIGSLAIFADLTSLIPGEQ